MSDPKVTAILRAQTNVPLTFVPARAVYLQGQYGPQVRFSTSQNELIYLPQGVGHELEVAGVLKPEGTKDSRGNDQLSVLRAVPVTVTRRRAGATEISVDGKPLHPTQSATPSKSWARSSTPRETVSWGDLARVHGKALDIVIRNLNDRASPLQALGVKVTFEGLMAGAATILISADKRGLPAPPEAPPSLDRIPQALTENNDDEPY